MKLNHTKIFCMTVVFATSISPVSADETVRASQWGTDDQAIARALCARPRKLVIDDIGRPWEVAEPLFPQSGIEIRFEKGVEVQAKRGAFRGKWDSLVDLRNADNVSLIGDGSAVLRLWRDDYAAKPYIWCPHRHGVAIFGCTNVVVKGISVIGAGGDGIYISGSVSAKGRENRGWSENVTVSGCVCDGSFRQGMSVTSVRNLLIEDTVLKNTKGSGDPEDGIDFEPNGPEDRLENIVMRNCLTEGNNGRGYHFALPEQEHAKVPVSIRLEKCRSVGDRLNAVSYLLGRNDPEHVRNDGRVVFTDCTFERSGKAAVVIRRKPFSTGTVEFHRCKILDCGAEDSYGTEFRVDVLGHCDVLPDVLTLDDVYIRQPVAREWLSLPAGRIFPGPPTFISGNVVVESPGGETKAFALDDVWRSANCRWEPRGGALPKAMFDPSKTEIRDASPGRLVRFTPISFQGRAAYVFHAAKAGKVDIRGRSNTAKGVEPSDVSMKLTTLSGEPVTEIRVLPPVKGELALDVDVPSPGFYRLEVKVKQRQYFCLTAADVPVAFDASSPIPFVWPSGSLYLAVPPGCRFELCGWGEGVQRTAMRIDDPSGNKVWNDDSVLFDRFQSAPDSPGGLWRVTFGKPASGVNGTFEVWVRGIPPFLFLTPEKTWGEKPMPAQQDDVRVDLVETTTNPVGRIVHFTMRPTVESAIRCRLFLPEPKAWTGRLRGVGNEGAAGEFKPWLMDGFFMRFARGGDATVISDLGTKDGCYGSRERLIDFGYRSTHLMTVAAKRMVAEHYGRPAAKAYFSGVSTGGGQGIHEALRYPEDYDGIVAIVPANDRIGIIAYAREMRRAACNADGSPAVTRQECLAVAEAAFERMSGRFLHDMRPLADRVAVVLDAAARRMPTLNEQSRRRRFERMFAAGLPLGVDAWGVVAGAAKPIAAWHFGRGCSVADVSDEEFARFRKECSSILDAIDPDLSAFAKRGGKLIMYNALQDSIIPFTLGLDYRNRVVAAMGRQAADCFFRYYLLPGREHFWRGLGPDSLSELKDVDSMIVDWVEKGKAPEIAYATAKDGTRIPIRPFTGWPDDTP